MCHSGGSWCSHGTSTTWTHKRHMTHPHQRCQMGHQHTNITSLHETNQYKTDRQTNTKWKHGDRPVNRETDRETVSSENKFTGQVWPVKTNNRIKSCKTSQHSKNHTSTSHTTVHLLCSHHRTKMCRRKKTPPTKRNVWKKEIRWKTYPPKKNKKELRKETNHKYRKKLEDHENGMGRYGVEEKRERGR